jgi:hypothetical protein
LETQGFTSNKEITHNTIIRKSDANSSALATLEANGEWCYCAHTLKLIQQLLYRKIDRVPEETVVSTDSAQPHVANVMTGASRHQQDTCNTSSIQSESHHCDFWSFPVLKHELRGQKFINTATATTLYKKSGNGMLHMFEKWVGHCKLCIAYEGCYFEKETIPKPPESCHSTSCHPVYILCI